MAQNDVQGSLDALRALRAEIAAAEPAVDVHPRHRVSAANLAHFLALRSADRRRLQAELAQLGLSSLGRSEAHVLASVDATLRALSCLAGAPVGEPAAPTLAPTWADGAALLRTNAERLLGPAEDGHETRIMVTLPTEAAGDPDLVDGLVDAGMDIARINGAHDDVDTWRGMAAAVRAAASRRGRNVRVLFDLPGPKLRTGPVEDGPAVVKLRPTRGPTGVVLEPARAMLVPDGRPAPAAPDDATVVPVAGGLLDHLEAGHEIRLRDARGSRRRLVVREVDADGARVETSRTTYLVPGTALDAPGGRGAVGDLPRPPGFVRLAVGDRLVLTTDLAPARAPTDGAPVRLGCTLPEAVAALAPGARVSFDDGRIEAEVDAVAPGEAELRVTSARPGGAKLRAEKGINLPDSDVDVAALGPSDLVALGAAVGFADMVALSFVRTPADVEQLQACLDALDAPTLGVLLKIETVQAFRNLPQLVASAMRSADCGVMIARGDLAVEAGYERLAEVQEEILWLAEAAHLPVVWATEVLDRMARTGRPSRSEITDAAMAVRAECVMLNKGPHVRAAIAVLDDILRRMAGHQHKKRSLLRQLRSWSSDFDGA
jgi:pyruvate kinase